jgi:cyclase
MKRYPSIALLALAATGSAHAQLDNLAESLRTTPITVQRVADDFYVLFGVGGNIAVSIGATGVLTVDTQFPQMASKYKEKIAELGGGDIDFAINSHWHFDHADGNLVLGPEGVWIVAQENSRDMLTHNNEINLVDRKQEQPAYPAEALPVITYQQQMAFEFNGEKVELLHFGPAHTAGDTAIYFHGHNAVHMGDVFNNAGYPFIDFDSGGSFEGMIDFCRQVLNRINTDTVVIPGHGAVADYVELADYTSMLSQIRDRVRELIEDGASLEQVVAARPTRRWDREQGDPGSFLNRVYASMTAATTR